MFFICVLFFASLFPDTVEHSTKEPADTEGMQVSSVSDVEPDEVSAGQVVAFGVVGHKDEKVESHSSIGRAVDESVLQRFRKILVPTALAEVSRVGQDSG